MTAAVSPSTTSSAIAIMIASLPGKYRYTPPADMPAAAMMSSIEVAWNPFTSNKPRAASKMPARRAERCSSLTLGTRPD